MTQPDPEAETERPNSSGTRVETLPGGRPRNKIQSLWYLLVRFGFRLLYNEMAWSYDLVSWLVSLGHWREWQKAAIPHLQGKLVLEIAHGPGHMLVELDSVGFQAVGIDLSPYMVKMASRNLQKAQRLVRQVRTDVRSLPFTATSMDSILSTFPADFIFDPRTVAELHRVLTPGGRVVIVAEGRLKGGGPVRDFIDWLFAITGQRVTPERADGSEPIWSGAVELVNDMGFSLTVEAEDLSHSEVTLVILTKPCT